MKWPKNWDWENKKHARFLDFEDNGSRYHSKCWYLRLLSDDRLITKIKSIIRSPEVKRSHNFYFYENLRYSFRPPAQDRGQALMMYFTL